MYTMTRPRIAFDCSEELRRAIKLRSTFTGIGASEVIVGILESHLQKELEMARTSLQGQQSTPKTRRGRKPKSAE